MGFKDCIVFFLAKFLFLESSLRLKSQRSILAQSQDPIFAHLFSRGLSYEYRAVNIDKGEQFTSEFDKLNPLHYVPVLVDGDVVISDSYAILLYLEEKYHQRPLLPVEPQLRALNLQRYMEERVGPEEKQLWVNFHIQKGFGALEKLLTESAGKYATGEEVYMADVFLAPQIAVATKRFNVDMSEFPTLRKIYNSCEALPEFKASLPERQPDAAL
ncbi:Glutathione S-transferase zeta class [Capsicum annuum]|nr:Glutathione S-transferase zeta class [Capsicum annuum]